jgi:O-antigen/teichoic acid export membrane protein
MTCRLPRIYANQPKPVKAAFWFTLCNIIPRGISFFVVPVYVRLLTTEQYGMYAIYSSWYAIVSVFATLNLGAGVFNNGMIKYEASRDAYTAAMQGLSTVSTAALFAAYLACKDALGAWLGLPPLLMTLMFAQCLLSPALGYWSARQRFEFKYRGLVAVTIVLALVTPLCGILAVSHAERKGEAIILGTVGAQLACFVFFYAYNFARGKKFFDRDQWRFALRFNLPLIPHYLSGMALGQADRVMIDRMVGREAAGIYSLAYTLSLAMNIIISGVNASFVPWTYQKMRAGQYRDIGKMAERLAAFFAVIILFFTAIAPEVIGIIATSAYYEAIWIMPPVAASVFFTLSLYAVRQH